MMTMTTTEARLAGPSRALVDSRLDTIDRMLIGHLPRQERLTIVREVETQVFELLQEQERPGEGFTREEVLAVLARLDPPEAYLPEMMAEGAELGQRRTIPATRPIPMPRKDHAQTAKASGILGLVVLALVLLSPLGYVFGFAFSSEAVILTWWFGTIALIVVGGTVSVALAFVSRLRGAWPIVGLVTSGFSMACAFLGAAWLLLELT